ncbi:MAG: DUF2225 domain-containing protein [Fibromonadaceae bacterium]|jgi:hypothetical protein|nr:DUF2225 domain-containing protein [Fibromonadaceae bacterium]
MSDDKDQEIRRRLLVLFKNHGEMVDAYVSQFGVDINMKNIQSIRAQFPGLGDTNSMPAIEEDLIPEDPSNPMSIRFKFSEKAFTIPISNAKLESPLFPRTVDCPVCKKWGVNAQDLKAKSLTVVNDPFLAPTFKTTGRFQEINYLLCCMTVCDSCLLASPDRKDFVVYNNTTRSNQESQLAPQVLRQLKDSTDQRKAFFEKTGVGDVLFEIPRSYAAAIVSYQLADIRAEIEADAKILSAYYKRGNYWTRIALLCRQAGMDDKRPLEIAVEHFKTAFTNSDFPKPELEFQTLHILFSIYLYFDKKKEAMDYMNVLGRTVQELEKQGDPRNETLLYAKKWLNITRTRWDDRDYPEIWKTPGLD